MRITGCKGRSIVGLAVVLLAWTRAASAQHSLFVVVNASQSDPPVSHLLVEVALSPTGVGPIQRQVTVSGLGGGAAASVDGRYVAWLVIENSVTRLAVLDRRTGAITFVPVAAGTRLFADPLVTRLYLVSSGTQASIMTVDASGIRSVAIGEVANATPIASNGRELFVTRSVSVNVGSGTSYRIAAVDLTTGVERFRLPDFLPTSTRPAGMALTRDGQRLAVSYNQILKVFDATNGGELATRAFATSGSVDSYHPLVFDQARNRLFVAYSSLVGSVASIGNLRVLDSVTLADLGQGAGLANFALNRTDAVGVNVVAAFNRFSGCSARSVETWGEANTPITSVQLPAGTPCVGSPVISSPPDPMSSVVRTVVGRRVTLSWSSVIGANDYLVEVGSTSGASNLAQVRTGGSLHFVADNVPPGTYYVRVRPENDIGRGSLSPEVIVVVQ